MEESLPQTHKVIIYGCPILFQVDLQLFQQMKNYFIFLTVFV